MEMIPVRSIQMWATFSFGIFSPAVDLGSVMARPCSILKIVVTMKKTISRNAMSAIEDVGILAPLPAFLLSSN